MRRYILPFFLFLVLILNCPVLEEEKNKSIYVDYSSINTPGDEYYVFVDVVNGTDGAAGTKNDPVDDINEGIGIADTNNKNVCTAKGFYYVNCPASGQINLMEGVCVYGGYNNNNGKWTRNIVTNETLIIDLGASANTRAVYCSAGITNATVIDGFTIRGGHGTSSSTGITCYGSCTISNNKIYSFLGTITYLNSYGIYVYGGNPVIEYNTIDGGDYQFSYGIRLFDGSTAMIRENTIYGGDGEYSYAVYCYPASPSILGNVLDGGTGSIVSNCIMIRTNVTASTPDVQKNTFDSSGGGISYGLYEVDNDAEPVYFINNEFASSFDTLYHDFSGSSAHDITTVVNVNALDENGYNSTGTVYDNYE